MKPGKLCCLGQKRFWILDRLRCGCRVVVSELTLFVFDVLMFDCGGCGCGCVFVSTDTIVPGNIPPLLSMI